MNAILLSLLLFTTQPNDSFVVSNSEFLVINHLYTEEDGKYRLTQFIFKEYDKYENDYNVIDWRLVETPANGQIIKYNIYKQVDIYVLTFWDNSIPRKIYLKEYKETWTQYDDEIIDLQKHSGREHRKGLPKGKK